MFDLAELPSISTAETFNRVSKERGWGLSLKEIHDVPYRWELIQDDGERWLQSPSEFWATRFALAFMEISNGTQTAHD